MSGSSPLIWGHGSHSLRFPAPGRSLAIPIFRTNSHKVANITHRHCCTLCLASDEEGFDGLLRPVARGEAVATPQCPSSHFGHKRLVMEIGEIASILFLLSVVGVFGFCVYRANCCPECGSFRSIERVEAEYTPVGDKTDAADIIWHLLSEG